MSTAAGPLLCSLAITAAFILLSIALVSQAEGQREDEAQFPVRDAGGDVR